MNVPNISHLFLFLLAVLLASCGAQPFPHRQPGALPGSRHGARRDHHYDPLPSRTPTLTPTATFDPLRPWGIFPGPDQTPVTQVPPPLSGLDRSR